MKGGGDAGDLYHEALEGLALILSPYLMMSSLGMRFLIFDMFTLIDFTTWIYANIITTDYEIGH